MGPNFCRYRFHRLLRSSGRIRETPAMVFWCILWHIHTWWLFGWCVDLLIPKGWELQHKSADLGLSAFLLGMIYPFFSWWILVKSIQYIWSTCMYSCPGDSFNSGETSGQKKSAYIYNSPCWRSTPPFFPAMNGIRTWPRCKTLILGAVWSWRGSLASCTKLSKILEFGHKKWQEMLVLVGTSTVHGSLDFPYGNLTSKTHNNAPPTVQFLEGQVMDKSWTPHLAISHWWANRIFDKQKLGFPCKHGKGNLDVQW